MTRRLKSVLKNSCWGTAVALLARRMCSRYEVEAYLKKREYETAEICATLHRLAEYGYLDDLEVGRQLVKKYGGRYGWQYIAAKLRQKGLFDPELLQALRELIDSTAERSSAAELLRKNHKRFIGANGYDKNKAARFLQNRGYATSVISQTIHIMSETDPD